MKIHYQNNGSNRHALVISSGRKKTPYCHTKDLPGQGRYLHYTKGYRKHRGAK